MNYTVKCTESFITQHVRVHIQMSYKNCSHYHYFLWEAPPLNVFSNGYTPPYTTWNKVTEQRSQTLDIHSISFGGYTVPCEDANAGL